MPADLALFGRGRDPKRVKYDDRELTLSESVSSNLSVDNLRDIRSYVQLPNIAQTLRTVHRSEFLPGLFRFQGKPYTLKGREPFKVLLNSEQPRKMIICAGRQISKSTSLAYTQVFDAISIPNFRILYVAPLEMQTLNFGNGYLTEALHSCELARRLQSRDLQGVFTDTKILTAVMHQSFANGSSIKLTYAKTSADRARGITADRIDFDEIQDQLIDNLPIITASLTTSEYQFERYTGTAKTVDNTIESLWRQSSMCEWVMPCSGCGHWNIPNEDGGVYDKGMIQADGLHCVKCDKRLNVYEGEWMATYDDRLSEFQGYHAPQIIFPFIVNSPALWSRLVMNKVRQPRGTFMQETLGLACDVGSRIITQKDIDAHSLLPSMLELQGELKRYVKLVGGIDWGGAEEASFTVHTILGIRSDGRLDCVYAHRYEGFDPDEVLPSIAQAQRFYGCECCLDEDSLVLTKTALTRPRYKRIIDVATTDWVWDGHEWVAHDGVKLMRRVNADELVTIGNTRLTGDHQVYIDDSTSRRADQVQGRSRASALAWRQSTSPVSGWYNVRILAACLARACANCIKEAFRRVVRAHKA